LVAELRTLKFTIPNDEQLKFDADIFQAGFEDDDVPGVFIHLIHIIRPISMTRKNPFSIMEQILLVYPI
jgi:hypothetical protein